MEQKEERNVLESRCGMRGSSSMLFFVGERFPWN